MDTVARKTELLREIKRNEIAIEELQNLSYFCHTEEETIETDIAIKILQVEIKQWIEQYRHLHFSR